MTAPVLVVRMRKVERRHKLVSLRGVMVMVQLKALKRSLLNCHWHIGGINLVRGRRGDAIKGRSACRSRGNNNALTNSSQFRIDNTLRVAFYSFRVLLDL
jgi:hypothetical protein